MTRAMTTDTKLSAITDMTDAFFTETDAGKRAATLAAAQAQIDRLSPDQADVLKIFVLDEPTSVPALPAYLEAMEDEDFTDFLKPLAEILTAKASSPRLARAPSISSLTTSLAGDPNAAIPVVGTSSVPDITWKQWRSMVKPELPERLTKLLGQSTASTTTVGAPSSSINGGAADDIFDINPQIAAKVRSDFYSSLVYLVYLGVGYWWAAAFFGTKGYEAVDGFFAQIEAVTGWEISDQVTENAGATVTFFSIFVNGPFIGNSLRGVIDRYLHRLNQLRLWAVNSGNPANYGLAVLGGIAYVAVTVFLGGLVALGHFIMMQNEDDYEKYVSDFSNLVQSIWGVMGIETFVLVMLIGAAIDAYYNWQAKRAAAAAGDAEAAPITGTSTNDEVSSIMRYVADRLGSAESNEIAKFARGLNGSRISPELAKMLQMSEDQIRALTPAQLDRLPWTELFTFVKDIMPKADHNAISSKPWLYARILFLTGFNQFVVLGFQILSLNDFPKFGMVTAVGLSAEMFLFAKELLSDPLVPIVVKEGSVALRRTAYVASGTVAASSSLSWGGTVAATVGAAAVTGWGPSKALGATSMTAIATLTGNGGATFPFVMQLIIKGFIGMGSKDAATVAIGESYIKAAAQFLRQSASALPRMQERTAVNNAYTASLKKLAPPPVASAKPAASPA